MWFIVICGLRMSRSELSVRLYLLNWWLLVLLVAWYITRIFNHFNLWTIKVRFSSNYVSYWCSGLIEINIILLFGWISVVCVNFRLRLSECLLISLMILIDKWRVPFSINYLFPLLLWFVRRDRSHWLLINLWRIKVIIVWSKRCLFIDPSWKVDTSNFTFSLLL